MFVLHLEFPFELWLDRNVSPWCSGSWKFHLTEKSRRYTSLFSTLFQGIRIFCFPCMNKIRINSAEAVVIWPAEGGACLLYDLTIFYTLIKSFACERISDFAAFIGTSLPGSSPFDALLLSAFFVSFFRSCMRPIVCDHKRRPCHQFKAGGGGWRPTGLRDCRCWLLLSDSPIFNWAFLTLAWHSGPISLPGLLEFSWCSLAYPSLVYFCDLIIY